MARGLEGGKESTQIDIDNGGSAKYYIE